MVPKHSSSFSLSSRKRREFFLTPRKALPTVGDTVPDPIISIFSQQNSSLGRLDGTSLRFPSLFLWKHFALDNLWIYRLGYNDKPLPMGQGCINK